MSKQQIKVRYSKLGLANFYGDYIEINYRLKYNKELRDHIVKHELGHSDRFDLHYEMKDGLKLIMNPRMSYLLISFYLFNPSTWIDLLPIQIRKRRIVYDLNLSILYFFSFILIFLLIKII